MQESEDAIWEMSFTTSIAIAKSTPGEVIGKQGKSQTMTATQEPEGKIPVKPFTSSTAPDSHFLLC